MQPEHRVKVTVYKANTRGQKQHKQAERDMGKAKKRKNKVKRPKSMRRPILGGHRAFGWIEDCVPVDRNAFKVAGRRENSSGSISGEVCVWCGSVFPNRKDRELHVASQHPFVADRFSSNRPRQD